MNFENIFNWLLIIVGCLHVSLGAYIIWTAWEVING